YTYQEPVLTGIVHVITYLITIVEYVVVSKHNPFGKTSSSRGILHIYNVVTVEGLCSIIQNFVINLTTESHKLRSIVHTPVLLRTYKDHVLKLRKTLRL